jgi:hypothetical protein
MSSIEATCSRVPHPGNYPSAAEVTSEPTSGPSKADRPGSSSRGVPYSGTRRPDSPKAATRPSNMTPNARQIENLLMLAAIADEAWTRAIQSPPATGQSDEEREAEFTATSEAKWSQVTQSVRGDLKETASTSHNNVQAIEEESAYLASLAPENTRYQDVVAKAKD